MTRTTARFDGKVLIPDTPLSLPRDVSIEIMVPDASHATGVGILQLAGVGAEVWAGVDALENQRREREGWE